MRVGIDLGTTNTLCSYINESGNVCGLTFRNGRKENRLLLPSCVSASGDGIIVGAPALEAEKKQSNRALRNTKYYMGSGEEWMLGRVKADASFAAVHILSEVMSELREQFPNEKDFRALVTVPARFDTQAPRLATKQALKDAGFSYDEENALMDEPVAAAASYARELGDAETVLVADFGGGTFDLSLLAAKRGGKVSLEPVGWGGDKHLGGNDIDERLFKLIAAKAERETGIALSCTDPRDLSYSPEQSAAVCMILEAMPDIKERLYAKESTGAELYLPELFAGYDLEMNISRDEYKSAVGDIAERMKELIDRLYASSPVSVYATDKVLVAGGMARELCLIGILGRIFGADKIIIPSEPLYLVARGAAICAGGADIHIDSRAYSSIGVLIHNNSDIDVIVTEGQHIDAGFRDVRYYYPAKDNAVSVTVNIVEYTGLFDPRRCRTVYRGTVALNKRLPAGKQRIRADFRMDKDNLFGVRFTRLDGMGTEVSLRL